MNFFPGNLCVTCIPCREREVTRSLLTRRNLPSIINGQHQIFAFQDREHLPFLCLHQPATQIFFRTSRLQSEIFAPIQRKSMLAPVKKFAISRENQTFCTDDCLGCGMLSSLAVFRRKAKRNCNMHMFSKPWSGEYGEMLLDFLWFWCENFHTVSWFGDRTVGV